MDLDDTIADFWNAFLKFYYTKTRNKHLKTEFIEYKKFWRVLGISLEEGIKIANEFHKKHSLDEVKPAEGAVEGIWSMLKNKDELFVITSRPIEFKKKIEKWIKYHLKTDKIKVIASGQFYRGDAKAKKCVELGIDVFFEDCGESGIECAKKEIKVVLFDAPWNKKFSHKNIKRVYNWGEAISELEKLRKN